MAINRRDFLRLGTAGLALGTVAPLIRCPFLSRPLQAALMGAPANKKMLLIFLRGGMDGVNVLIPHGDDDYSTTSRPTLFIDPDDAHDLNGYASAHPEFDDVIQDVPAEDIAWVHRVGYDPYLFSRSHFDGQNYWENAYPGSYTDHGWVNKLIRNADGIQKVTFPAASISSNLQLSFRGPDPLAHIQDLNNYSFDEIGVTSKLLGALPGQEDNGTGLLGIYSRKPDDGTYDGLVRGHGLALASSLEALAGLDPDTYVPTGGATYPVQGAAFGFGGDSTALAFFRELKQSVMLLKLTDCMVCGIQLDGFDTHSGQAGQLARLVRILDHAIWAVYNDTKDSVWEDLVVVTMSEFGRTSDENGSMGTDHAEASCMVVAGGGVNGGVYNCDADTWGNGGLYTSPSGRYVGQRTDFRAVLAEIVDVHFQQGAILDNVIYNWSNLSGSSFDYLNLFKK